MVIFAAIAMIVVVIAGFVLLWSTDWAQARDASNAQFYTFQAMIAVGAPAIWSALNIALLATRSQTGGQYVVGIRMIDENGARLSLGKAAAWWFCFNPLLFSWPMAITIGLPLSAIVVLLLGFWMVFAAGFVVVLCVVLPVVTLVAATLDAHNRTLHDRVAGVCAVPSA